MQTCKNFFLWWEKKKNRPESAPKNTLYWLFWLQDQKEEEEIVLNISSPIYSFFSYSSKSGGQELRVPLLSPVEKRDSHSWFKKVVSLRSVIRTFSFFLLSSPWLAICLNVTWDYHFEYPHVGFLLLSFLSHAILSTLHFLPYSFQYILSTTFHIPINLLVHLLPKTHLNVTVIEKEERLVNVSLLTIFHRKQLKRKEEERYIYWKGILFQVY